MHRFFLPPDKCLDSKFWLEGREANHAAVVLRLRPGDGVTVLDGAGHEFVCEIGQISKRQVMLSVTGKKYHPPLPARLTLAQAIPKGKTFDVIIQKATELGAHRVVPILSERVVTRLTDARDASAKVEKWRQVAIESIKQCGSPWLPEISSPIAFPEYVTRAELHELSLVAALTGSRQHPRQHLEAFHREHRHPPKSIRIWIGPEGDFAPGELDALLSAGARPISLGPNVLRAETAAIYCLSVLSYELHSPQS